MWTASADTSLFFISHCYIYSSLCQQNVLAISHPFIYFNIWFIMRMPTESGSSPPPPPAPNWGLPCWIPWRHTRWPRVHLWGARAWTATLRYVQFSPVQFSSLGPLVLFEHLLSFCCCASSFPSPPTPGLPTIDAGDLRRNTDYNGFSPGYGGFGFFGEQVLDIISASFLSPLVTPIIPSPFCCARQ